MTQAEDDKLLEDDLAGLLREVAKAAEEVVRTDATTRENLRTLADRLLEEARKAHVYAASPTFHLVEDTEGQGHGVYAYLSVGTGGFHLATRTEWDDITGQSIGPDGEEYYRVRNLDDWPVEWLRLIVQENRMSQLATELLAVMRARVVAPNKSATLPAEFQLPRSNVVGVAVELNFTKVVDAWRESQRELATDPTSALRSACVLLETVCKHVLRASSAEIPDTATLPQLYKAAEKVLVMDRDERTLASGLRATVDGIAHGRSHLSNAHGAGPNDEAPTAWHAELAVAAAGALSVHLMRLVAGRSSPAKTV